MSQKKPQADLSEVRKVEKMLRHNGQRISFCLGLIKAPVLVLLFFKKPEHWHETCTKLPEPTARDSSPCLVHLLEKNRDQNLKGRIELLTNQAQNWDSWAPCNLWCFHGFLKCGLITTTPRNHWLLILLR